MKRSKFINDSAPQDRKTTIVHKLLNEKILDCVFQLQQLLESQEKTKRWKNYFSFLKRNS